MDNEQNPTSSQPIFSSSLQPTGGSIFGTFNQTSQGSAYTSTSPQPVSSQGQLLKKNIFGSITAKTGKDLVVNRHMPGLPSSLAQGVLRQPSSTFTAGQSIIRSDLHQLPSNEQRSTVSHEPNTESEYSREEKRKQMFMKKMISQSIFGARPPKPSVQTSKYHMQDRAIIQKRPFDAGVSPMSFESGGAKRRSLRDAYPAKAAALGSKRSLVQEQVFHEDRVTSSRNLATTPTVARRRKTSSGIAEQIAASTTIICHDVPENMNTQESLRQYFSQFGEIMKIATNREKQTATIGYKTHEMAAAAKSHGYYNPVSNMPLKIFYLKKVRKSSDKNPFKIEDALDVKSSGLSSRPHVAPQCNIKSLHPAIYAKNDSEKMAILEKVDSLLRKQIVRQSDITKAKTCKGTCFDMCPEKERYVLLVVFC